jgi:uncharacterized protein YciI
MTGVLFLLWSPGTTRELEHIMARWVAMFEDDESAVGVREKYTQDHLIYLSTNKSKIVLAGGLKAEPGGKFDGGLWILEVADRKEAMHYVENDPFFKNGLRKSAQVYAWGKAFPEVMVTL